MEELNPRSGNRVSHIRKPGSAPHFAAPNKAAIPSQLLLSDLEFCNDEGERVASATSAKAITVRFGSNRLDMLFAVILSLLASFLSRVVLKPMPSHPLGHVAGTLAGGLYEGSDG